MQGKSNENIDIYIYSDKIIPLFHNIHTYVRRTRTRRPWTWSRKQRRWERYRYWGIIDDRELLWAREWCLSYEGIYGLRWWVTRSRPSLNMRNIKNSPENIRGNFLLYHHDYLWLLSDLMETDITGFALDVRGKTFCIFKSSDIA